MSHFIVAGRVPWKQTEQLHGRGGAITGRAANLECHKGKFNLLRRRRR